MKEAYAVKRTVPPSAEIEARIEQMLAVGGGENPREALSELAKLGARLIIQRRGERGERAAQGFRPRKLQTAEGELEIEMPQVRQAAETFASKLFPRTPKLLRTEPLKAW
jgi:hypothetical protein